MEVPESWGAAPAEEEGCLTPVGGRPPAGHEASYSAPSGEKGEGVARGFSTPLGGSPSQIPLPRGSASLSRGELGGQSVQGHRRTPSAPSSAPKPLVVRSPSFKPAFQSSSTRGLSASPSLKRAVSVVRAGPSGPSGPPSRVPSLRNPPAGQAPAAGQAVESPWLAGVSSSGPGSPRELPAVALRGPHLQQAPSVDPREAEERSSSAPAPTPTRSGPPGLLSRVSFRDTGRRISPPAATSGADFMAAAAPVGQRTSSPELLSGVSFRDAFREEGERRSPPLLGVALAMATELPAESAGHAFGLREAGVEPGASQGAAAAAAVAATAAAIPARVSSAIGAAPHSARPLLEVVARQPPQPLPMPPLGAPLSRQNSPAPGSPSGTVKRSESAVLTTLSPQPSAAWPLEAARSGTLGRDHFPAVSSPLSADSRASSPSRSPSMAMRSGSMVDPGRSLSPRSRLPSFRVAAQSGQVGALAEAAAAKVAR